MKIYLDQIFRKIPKVSDKVINLDVDSQNLERLITQNRNNIADLYSVLASALVNAANEAYKNEVLDTGMFDSLVGRGRDYEDKWDWIGQRIEEWLELSN